MTGPRKPFIHRYQLEPTDGAQARPGALIQVGGGYADLHPWPELGDAPLEAQLQALQEGQNTPLLTRALWCAEQDARARQEGRSLFEGLKLPDCHRLWLGMSRWTDDELRARADRAAALGFGTLKIKCGQDPALEVKQLEKLVTWPGLPFRLRLDFNARLSQDAFHTFIHLLSSEVLDRIDFIEDPFVWDRAAWFSIQERYGVRLAVDRVWTPKLLESEVPGFEIYVVKPAVQDPWPVLEAAAQFMKRVVFTSYLDHPLGQAFAAWEAARALDRHPLLLDVCGLASQDAYQLTSFAGAWPQKGPKLSAPEGTGLGFDEALAGLSWERL